MAPGRVEAGAGDEMVSEGIKRITSEHVIVKEQKFPLLVLSPVRHGGLADVSRDKHLVAVDIYLRRFGRLAI